MDKKRVLFWGCFIIILALIVWGLIAAMSKPSTGTGPADAPAVTAADHITGNPNAPVTLIEYGDFECPACGLYYPIVGRLMTEASSTVKLVFRHFPLPQHTNAVPAALAAEAASQQGKFWDMYNNLYSNQDEWNNLSDPTPVFEKYAMNMGLNLAKYRTDVASSALKDIITADEDGGVKIGINQTPTFFVNGKAIVNPQNYNDFKSLIETAASSSTQ